MHAAQKLNRQWIGIDITHLAVTLIEKRLKDAFPDIKFEIHGTPKDLEGARNLAERDKYQFQWWACSLVNAQPYQGKKKGADGGIDGLIFFQDDDGMPKKIVVSVKGGENVSVAMVRDLAHVVEREKAEIGLFVTLAPPTKPMLAEASKIGFYESPLIGKAFPKLQILTIEDLLEGKEEARYPDLGRGGLTFKKAKVEGKGCRSEGFVLINENFKQLTESPIPIKHSPLWVDSRRSKLFGGRTMTPDREELQQSYSRLSDAEVTRLAACGTLTELAQSVAVAELRARGLPIPVPPQPKPVEDEVYPGRMRIVARNLSYIEAHILSSLLNAEGIPAQPGNVNLVQTNTLLSIAVGGACIYVREAFAAEAARVIADYNRGRYRLHDDVKV